MRTLVKHYYDLTNNLTSSLQDLESKLDCKAKENPISNREKKRVLFNLYKSELEEDRLKNSLERMRRGKLKRLTHDSLPKDSRPPRDTRHHAGMLCREKTAKEIQERLLLSQQPKTS